MNIIKYFIQQHFIGSVTKAADFLYISQPAVTKSIQKLETELGITLFNRSPKGVTLTENGKIFYNFIKNKLWFRLIIKNNQNLLVIFYYYQDVLF